MAKLPCWRSVGIGDFGCSWGGGDRREGAAIDISRRVFIPVHACRIADGGAGAERTLLVEGVHQLFAVMVEEDSETCADGGFGVGRINDREAWSEVSLLLRPITGFVIEGPARGKRKVWLVNLPHQGRRVALQKPGMGVDGG